MFHFHCLNNFSIEYCVAKPAGPFTRLLLMEIVPRLWVDIDLVKQFPLKVCRLLLVLIENFQDAWDVNSAH